VHRDKLLITNTTRCIHFSNLFWNKTLHVSDSSSVHHREFSTVHTAMLYVIELCWQLASRIRMALPFWSCSQAVSKLLWHIPLLCVQWKTPDDGRRNCPKHVEFHSKNEFEKWMRLVVFVIRNLKLILRCSFFMIYSKCRVFKCCRRWFTLLSLGSETLNQVPEKYVWLWYHILFICVFNCRGTALFIKPLPKNEIMLGIYRCRIIEAAATVADVLGKR
jgi:hypothetical protein